jgi:predicted dithiol-disulfide oxidoreductase (DUF899 family)
MSTTATTTDEIRLLQSQIADLKKRLGEARRRASPVVVPNLPLLSREGTPTSLAACFGNRSELLVIHNMGSRCVYCTLWADGFVGLWPHLNDRCAFVLVSEDEPAVLDGFARSRGWPFPVVSMYGSEFANALGVGYEGTHQNPGVSAFTRDAAGTIRRTGHAEFGPGDDFCAMWPFVELFGDTPEWKPKYNYTQGCGPGCCCAGG